MAHFGLDPPRQIVQVAQQRGGVRREQNPAAVLSKRFPVEDTLEDSLPRGRKAVPQRIPQNFRGSGVLALADNPGKPGGKRVRIGNCGGRR